jgi:hypothetical protein
MKKITLLLPLLALFTGCGLTGGPEEIAIKQMVTTFIAAIDKNDKDLAYACLLDMNSFMVLNPDAAARLDADSFSEEVIADLVHEFQYLVGHFEGHTLKVKKFYLGTPWYQYKGYSAFVDSDVVLSVDGEDVTLPIRGIVRIGDRWRIVDLSGIDLY